MNPSDDGGLHFGIESELPREIAVGRGNVLTLYGWCFHSRKPIRRLEVLLDGEAQPLIAHGMPRPDVLHHLTEMDAPTNAYRSGFWGLLSLGEVGEPRDVEIRLSARLAGGDKVSRHVGRVNLLPGERKAWARVNGGRPQVAICMATFNPPSELFRRQIESIRAQTYENWTCLISDDDSSPEAFAEIEQLVGRDSRFQVERRPRRLGYYRNFERVLASVPAEAELVALADQDDHWHPDKLAVLVGQISDGVTLAYSDARVTDGEGNIISPTFWTERTYNTDDLGALLLVNSVTGGSVLFRSELLDHVLPFPSPVDSGFHDHWVGMVAMSLGEVAYVDRPLYDYVQHQSAVLGHESLRRPLRRKGLARLRAFSSRSELRKTIVRRSSWARLGYLVVLGVRASAELLLLRGGHAISGRKRRMLRRYARLERSPTGWAWLMVRARTGRAKTLGSERWLVAGSLWRAATGTVKRLGLPPPSPDAEALSTWLRLPLPPQSSTTEPQSTRIDEEQA